MNLNLKNKKILITGGCGFLGWNLRQALSLDYDLYILDKIPYELAQSKLLGITHEQYIECDLRDSVDKLSECIESFDVIIHLAATSNTQEAKDNFSIDLDNSLKSTWVLAEAMKRASCNPHVIFPSSQHVYGHSASEPDLRDRKLLPVSSYGAAKIGAEAIFSAYSMQGCLTATIVRLSNIIGPRENYGVLVDFIKRLKTNPNKLEIWGDGSQRRNFLHVSDLVSLISTLIEHKCHEKIKLFDVGNSESLSVSEMASILIEVADLPQCELQVQKQLSYGWKGDPGTIYLKSDGLQELGWSPKLNVREAVRQAAHELWEEIQ